MPDSFDRLYSVSDLHLGGLAGSQIFREGDLLAKTIAYICQAEPDRSVCLVLNGDVVDYLAEQSPGATSTPIYLQVGTAVDTLDRIVRDKEFAPVFAALAGFVRTERRHLVIVMGNHDVEFGLPDVRERLSTELAGTCDAGRGRITWAVDGTGYHCRVGDRTVLCFHGEIADPWNVVDHDALRRIVRELKAGTKPRDWNPNGGTKLVVDVMNEVKREHPFVDLLKPETRAAIPILATMAPRAIRQLRSIVHLVNSGMRAGKTAVFEPWLGSGDTTTEIGEDFDALMMSALGEGTAEANAAGRLLDQVELRHDQGVDPLDLVDQDGDELLSAGGFVLDFLRRRPREQILRELLESFLARDFSFSLTEPDEPFRWSERHVGAGVDVVVAGHTHLRRAIRRHAGGAYFNSGTWISLIQLTPEMVASDEEFGKVYQRLRAGSLAELEAAHSGLVAADPTVVRVIARADGVVGDLVRPWAVGPSIELRPIADSELAIR